MDHPYYTVTITGLDPAGWSMTSTEGVSPDPDAPLQLTDGLTYSWSFTSGQVPGHLEPATVSFSYASTGPDVDPMPDIGAVVRVQIVAGTSGPSLLDYHGRVASVDTELIPTHRLPLRHTIALVDLLGDLRARFPNPTTGQEGMYWDHRLMFLSLKLGHRFAIPTWWGAQEPFPRDKIEISNEWPDSSADEFLASILNTYAPRFIHHTTVPQYNGQWPPAGYREMNFFTDTPREWSSDPDNPQRYVLAPAGREFYGPYGLPYTLAWTAAGLLGRRVVDDPNHLDKLPIIDACWCRLPAKARRSRDHDVNTIIVEGWSNGQNGPGSFSSGVTGSRQRPGLGSSGARSRSVPTEQIVRFYPDENDANNPNGWWVAAQAAADKAVSEIAAVFMPDESAASWSFDAFEVSASLIPQSIANKLLPMLIPRFPGDGDGTILRHMTLHNLPPEAQIAGPQIDGFMVGGSLTITGGELTYQITTTPGTPTVQGTTGAVTLEQLRASEFGAVACNQVDPTLKVLDTRLVSLSGDTTR